MTNTEIDTDNVVVEPVYRGQVLEHFRTEIRPNHSMSPRNLRIFVACIAVVCLSIALGFLSQGLWMVMPFAGLEIFVVGVVVGYIIRHSEDYELVVVDDNNVTITKYRGHKMDRAVFQRYWARVKLVPGATRLQPSRLVIGSHGRFVNFGTQMTEQAREKLAARLQNYLRAAG